MDKSVYMVKCDKCGAVIDISTHSEIQTMRVKINYLKEVLKATSASCRIARIRKIAEAQAFHLAIRNLLDLMTPEQKDMAKMVSQRLRDTIKHIEKRR